MTATATSRSRLHGAWVAGYAQIVEGEAVCDCCGSGASVLLHCEPDYRKTPMCWTCARPFLELALSLGDNLWGTEAS